MTQIESPSSFSPSEDPFAAWRQGVALLDGISKRSMDFALDTLQQNVNSALGNWRALLEARDLPAAMTCIGRALEERTEQRMAQWCEGVKVAAGSHASLVAGMEQLMREWQTTAVGALERNGGMLPLQSALQEVFRSVATSGHPREGESVKHKPRARQPA